MSRGKASGKTNSIPSNEQCPDISMAPTRNWADAFMQCGANYWNPRAVYVLGLYVCSLPCLPSQISIQCQKKAMQVFFQKLLSGFWLSFKTAYDDAPLKHLHQTLNLHWEWCWSSVHIFLSESHMPLWERRFYERWITGVGFFCTADVPHVPAVTMRFHWMLGHTADLS